MRTEWIKVGSALRADLVGSCPIPKGDRKPEYYLRTHSYGCQVTATGDSAIQPSAAGSTFPQLLAASLTHVSPCQRVPSRLCRAHLCTFARGSAAVAPLHCICAPSQSSGLRFPFERSVVPLSTCQLVNLPASVLFWPTNAAVLVHRASGPPGLSLLAP